MCPKHAGTERLADRVPLAEADDPAAGGWVWEAVGWAREGLAVGTFDRPPDPLMRQVVRVVKEFDGRLERRATARAVADGVTDGMLRAAALTRGR